MYFPAKMTAPPSAFGLKGVEDVLLETSDKVRLQAWVHAARSGYPTLLYFHGNALHLGERAAWIARLLPCGVRLVQLRIKDKPDATIRAGIAKAKALCSRDGAQFVVNDYWQQAIDAGCDFIHLGQGDLATADLAAIRRAGIKFGVSTHDEAELSRALGVSPDYIALGPVYPTILKAMAFAPQGLPRITEWKKKIGNIPLVAIGGITLERVVGECCKRERTARRSSPTFRGTPTPNNARGIG